MNFIEIQNKARAQWSALEEKIHIKIGAATCGRAAGALEVLQAFEEELSRKGLEVPVIQVGALVSAMRNL